MLVRVFSALIAGARSAAFGGPFWSEGPEGTAMVWTGGHPKTPRPETAGVACHGGLEGLWG